MSTRKQPGPGPQQETDAKGNLHGCFGLQVKAAWKRYAEKHKYMAITRAIVVDKLGRPYKELREVLAPNYHQGKF